MSVAIKTLLICLLLSGCAALPFNGKYLERAIDSGSGSRAGSGAGAGSCQCTAVCSVP